MKTTCFVILVGRRLGVPAAVPLLALALLPAPGAHAAAGDLDSSFHGDGRERTPMVDSRDIAHDVAIQPDGKIVAAGEPHFSVARYNPDGSLDTSFSGDGRVYLTDFFSGGTGVVTSSMRSSVPAARWTHPSAATVSKPPIPNLAAEGGEIQADGKIVLGGRRCDSLGRSPARGHRLGRTKVRGPTTMRSRPREGRIVRDVKTA